MSNAEQQYKEEHWTYSEYDEEYYEDDDDVTEYMCWNAGSHCYVETSISKDSLDQLLDNEDAFLFDGVAYDELDAETGLPYGLNLIRKTGVEAA